MIKCPNNECGFENQDGSKFCAACGAKLDIKMHCTQCGAELSAGAKFCSSCGAVVNANAAKIENVGATHHTQQTPPKQTADIETDISNLPRANAGFYEYFDRFRGIIPMLAVSTWKSWSSYRREEKITTEQRWHPEGCYGYFIDKAQVGYLGEFKRNTDGFKKWITFYGSPLYNPDGDATDDKWEYDGDYFDNTNEMVKKGKISTIIDKCKTMPIFSLIDSDNIEAIKQYIKNNSSVVTADTPISPLLAAAMTGSIAMAKLLIEAGADVNAASREFKARTPLMIAASRGDTVMLKFLLDNGAMDFVPCEDGCLPLHYAACSDEGMECLKVLSSRKTVDINTKNNDGETALDLAIRHDTGKCIECLKQLDATAFDERSIPIKEENNVDIDRERSIVKRAVIQAVKFDKLNRLLKKDVQYVDGDSKIKELLATGELSFYDKNYASGIYLLQHICDDMEMLRLLMRNGVDPLKDNMENTKDNQGRTLLERTNNPDIARLLMRCGAKVISSVLFNVVKAKDTNRLLFLLECGADVNSKDSNCNTLLHCAIEQNNIEIAKLLIEQGGDVSLGGKEGNALLCNAVERNNIELVKLLIEHGVNVSAQDSNGSTPLHVAARRNALDIAKLLIACGADTNAKDREGGTPLHRVLIDNAELVKVLVEHGADVNAKDNDGFTPLHFAVSCGRCCIARLLIEYGTDVNAHTKKGETPMDFVNGKFVNAQEMIALLQANGGKKSSGIGRGLAKLFG